MKKTPGRKSRKVKQDELNDLFAELRIEYLDTFHEKIKAIEGFWQTKNRKELANEFHKIKGTGTTYGIQEVTEVAEVMEDLCHQSSPKLGFGILLSLELFKKICDSYKHEIPFELTKDRMFKMIRSYQ